MNKILTIVIPSYNTEQYMDECLPTFLTSDEILDDLELLIVDDGSKDGTAKKGKEYEVRYPNTVRVISKENGGHGSTINTGIREAKGEYFRVIDGDDWVDTKGLVEFIQYLKTTDCDLVLTPYMQIDMKNGTEKMQFSTFMKQGDCYFFDQICKDMTVASIHSYTIKTEILRDNAIEITEHSFYVDTEFVLYPISYLHTVCFCETTVTMYRYNTPTQSMNIKSLRKNIGQHDLITKKLLKFYRNLDQNMDSNRMDYIRRFVFDMAVMHLKTILEFPICKEEKQRFIDFDVFLKKDFEDVYVTVPSWGLRGKIIHMMRKTSYGIYPIAALVTHWHSRFFR